MRIRYEPSCPYLPLLLALLGDAKTTEDSLYDKADDKGADGNKHDGDQDAQALSPRSVGSPV